MNSARVSSTQVQAHAGFTRAWLTPLVLGLAVFAVYANALHGPFVFDDAPAIERNASIRSLALAWQPPADGSPVTGRPLLNASFAVNYAFAGLDVRAYHVTNVAIHLVATLALFGTVRCTLLSARAPAVWRTHALANSFVVALLWGVHPLPTAAIDYIAQRAECMAGMFFLLTLFAFARGVASPRRMLWHGLAVAACFAGVACKETVAVAPVVVLAWDRTFSAGTFREAWRRHAGAHLGLFASWIPLALFVAHSGGRGGSAGFGTHVSSVDYTLTQAGAIVRYLVLTVWPQPLVFDYGATVVTSWAAALLPGLLVVSLLTLAGWAFWRRPAWGFFGLFFFVTLAPASSFVPVATQTMAEHRMYLPLAAVITLLVLSAGRWTARPAWWIGCTVIAAGLGTITTFRNTDYATAEKLWRDTTVKRPNNARAHHNLGHALLAAGRAQEAIPYFTAALRLEPNHVKAHDGLGLARLASGDVAGAVAEATVAVRLDPDFVAGRVNLGAALVRAGRIEEAMREFREALRREPQAGDANLNLGLLLLERNQPADAIPPLQAATAAMPESALARFTLAQAHALVGQFDEAIGHFTAGLQLAPRDAEAHHRLGLMLARVGRTPEAKLHLEETVRLRPDFPEARANLGNVCLQSGEVATAIAHYEAALRLNPQLAGVRENLSLARDMIAPTRP